MELESYIIQARKDNIELKSGTHLGPQGIYVFHDYEKGLEHAKKEGNLDEDDKLLNDDDLKQRYKKISERRVKLGLLMQHIASEEKVVVSQEEINKGILEYSSQYPGQEKQIMEYFETDIYCS